MSTTTTTSIPSSPDASRRFDWLHKGKDLLGDPSRRQALAMTAGTMAVGAVVGAGVGAGLKISGLGVGITLTAATVGAATGAVRGGIQAHNENRRSGERSKLRKLRHVVGKVAANAAMSGVRAAVIAEATQWGGVAAGMAASSGFGALRGVRSGNRAGGGKGEIAKHVAQNVIIGGLAFWAGHEAASRFSDTDTSGPPQETVEYKPFVENIEGYGDVKISYNGETFDVDLPGTEHDFFDLTDDELKTRIAGLINSGEMPADQIGNTLNELGLKIDEVSPAIDEQWQYPNIHTDVANGGGIEENLKQSGIGENPSDWYQIIQNNREDLLNYTYPDPTGSGKMLHIAYDMGNGDIGWNYPSSDSHFSHDAMNNVLNHLAENTRASGNIHVGGVYDEGTPAEYKVDGTVDKTVFGDNESLTSPDQQNTTNPPTWLQYNVLEPIRNSPFTAIIGGSVIGLATASAIFGVSKLYRRFKSRHHSIASEPPYITPSSAPPYVLPSYDFSPPTAATTTSPPPWSPPVAATPPLYTSSRSDEPSSPTRVVNSSAPEADIPSAGYEAIAKKIFQGIIANEGEAQMVEKKSTLGIGEFPDDYISHKIIPYRGSTIFLALDGSGDTVIRVGSNDATKTYTEITLMNSGNRDEIKNSLATALGIDEDQFDDVFSDLAEANVRASGDRAAAGQSPIGLGGNI